MENFRYKKQLGQHFLKDKNISKKIVNSANIEKNETVWEIGPGKGILTEFLSEKTSKLTLFEIDDRLIEELDDEYPHAEIVCSDILAVDWKKQIDSKHIKIVSNLPYQITSPFLFRVAENAEFIDKTVVMIQREVADRINAKPGSKTYGILSLKMQYYFNVSFLFGVKRHLFIPPPDVDSAVISLVPRKDKPEISNIKLFWRIIEISFRNRRKMLRKNLRQIVDQSLLPTIEKESNIDLTRRGESLREEEFVNLYNSIKTHL